MGSVGPRTELCEQGRDTLAVQCTMRAVIKVLAILVPWLALTSSRPSVVDLSTLSLDAREDLNGVWRKHFDAAEETNSIGDAPSLSFYRNPSKDNNKNYIFGHKTTDSSAESFLNHAEASNGFGTKLGRFSYIDAKDKFFSEFNARRKLHAQQKQDKSIVLKSTAVESGKTRKPSTAIVPQVPEDTPEVRRAKDQFFKEFNARKALHAKQRQGKEEDASMATHDEEEMDESEASLKENDEEEENEEGDGDEEEEEDNGDEEEDEEEEDSEEEEEDSDEEDEDSSSSSSSSSEEDEEEDDDVNG